MALPTYDYEAEQAALARQMKLAEVMQAQSLQPMGPTESIGGVAIQKSPLEAIAKVAQALSGQYQQRGVEARRKELGQRYAGELKTGIEDLIGGMGTQAGQQPPVADESGGHGGMPFDAAGAQEAKRAAILRAVGSSHPVLQQLGMSHLTQMGKDNVTVKDLLPHADPTSIPGMVAGGASNFKPKQELGEVGGIVYDKNTKQVVQIGNGYKPEERIKIDGDFYQLNPSTRKLEKLDNASKVSVGVSPTTIMNHGQRKLSEAWVTQAAKTVAELSDTGRAAERMESSLNTIEKLNANPMFSGPASTPAIFMSGLAKQMGIPVDEAKLNNSDTFNSEATRMWVALMQQAGGARGLVKEESEKLMGSLPNLVQTPQGRQQIVTRLRQAAQKDRQIAIEANKQLGEAQNADDATKFTFGLIGAQLPQTGGPLPAAPGVSAPGNNKPTKSNW